MSTIIFVSAQIDAVGGDHNLLMPSLHEQIREVDQIIMYSTSFRNSNSIHFLSFTRHPNYTHSDASIGGLAVSATKILTS